MRNRIKTIFELLPLIALFIVIISCGRGAGIPIDDSMKDPGGFSSLSLNVSDSALAERMQSFDLEIDIVDSIQGSFRNFNKELKVILTLNKIYTSADFTKLTLPTRLFEDVVKETLFELDEKFADLDSVKSFNVSTLGQYDVFSENIGADFFSYEFIFKKKDVARWVGKEISTQELFRISKITDWYVVIEPIWR